MITKMLIGNIFFLWFFPIFTLSSEASPSIDLPVTRKDFLEIVYRGLSKSDLIEKIGSPLSEKKLKTPRFTNLFFQNKIRSSTGRIEGVTVVIFNDYDNVYSVIWSDGTEAEW